MPARGIQSSSRSSVGFREDLRIFCAENRANGSCTLSTLFFFSFFFNRAIYQRRCDFASLLIFAAALNHLNSAEAKAERQHKSPFSPPFCSRVMSAAADKDAPVVKADKYPTTIRLSLLARSRILTRHARRRVDPRRTRGTSISREDPTQCESDACRQQQSRYLMIYRQVLPARFVLGSLLSRTPALRRPLKEPPDIGIGPRRRH